MTVEITITVCALIHFMWSLFQIFCHLNFIYCFHLIPYVILIILLSNLDINKRKKSDISVQTDVEKCPMTKDFATITDNFACGDTKIVGFQTANSAPSTLEDCEQTCVQQQINPFLDISDNLPADTEGKNLLLTGTTSNLIPLLLYQGENEEAPEIDPGCFEVDEPELIQIFQNSNNVFSFLDNPCPQDFVNNPFLTTNPFELKDTNPFKGPIIETTSKKIPLLLYQGENEEAPEIESGSFEVDEPELINILQDSNIVLDLFEHDCPQNFRSNQFLGNNRFQLKDTNPFKGPINEITSPFYGISNECRSPVQNTSVPKKKNVSSYPKRSLKRKAHKFMVWLRTFHLISVILAANGLPLVPVIFPAPGFLLCVCHLGIIRLSTSFLSSRWLMAFHPCQSSFRLLAIFLVYVILASSYFPLVPVILAAPGLFSCVCHLRGSCLSTSFLPS
ncbi:hypothetical protein AVEN_144713-1 [Araneus ventricosus]|uniref:Uncharacterized protein n=1 Tax=Araneus ventricosus TaxID=182803 RepID=A0A4Y2VGG5_ARAVE|nr:hypothetical protein AVEN_144713-1 [Araneus ventricosus]